MVVLKGAIEAHLAKMSGLLLLNEYSAANLNGLKF